MRSSAWVADLAVRWIVAFGYIINAPAASSGWSRENRPYPCTHDVHHGTATRACELGAFFDPSQGPVRVKAQQILKHGDQTFAVGVQEAEVAGASEAFGQHMLEDQPQEPGAGDCSVFAALRFAVPVAKGR